MFEKSPYLKRCIVDYDIRWLGNGQKSEEIWADAIKLGLTKKDGLSYCADENKLAELFNLEKDRIDSALERILLATFIRLSEPAGDKINDKDLAEKLGMSIYLLLGNNPKKTIDSLQVATAEKEDFCSLRSLCFSLGAYVKNHPRAQQLGVWNKEETEDKNTLWQWGDTQLFKNLRAEYSPNAKVSYAE